MAPLLLFLYDHSNNHVRKVSLSPFQMRKLKITRQHDLSTACSSFGAEQGHWGGSAKGAAGRVPEFSLGGSGV